MTVVNRDSELLKGYGVKEIGLFGSVARGDDHEGSDYDILVVFNKEKKSYKNFLALVDYLELELGDPVEVVTREGLSPYIGPHILKEVEYVPIAS